MLNQMGDSITPNNQQIKHDLESANLALKKKGLNEYLSVIAIDGENVILLDKEFGEYKTLIKNLCPSSKVPPHKKRKHVERLNSLRKKYVGAKIKEATVLDIFYGPDRGYKNRSFYFEYIGECNHSGISTYAHLTRHKKGFECNSCSKTIHGERAKENNVQKKRSSTYNAWLKWKDHLPEKHQDFEYFRTHVGDKPFRRADIKIIDGKPEWVNLSIAEEEEINKIATAVRQAFRHSYLYKECLEAARVETEDGTRYQCASCGKLSRRKDVQIDHIVPISPLDGSPLKKTEIIDRIWTDKIQVLDKKCHTKKSTTENKQRKLAKKQKEIK